MDRNPIILKALGIGIILMLEVMIVLPCANATVRKTSSTSFISLNEDPNNLYDQNVTRYMFCFIKSGDVQLRNFHGRFHGVTIIMNSGIRHFGIGTFQLDLIDWNNSTWPSLTITQFRRSSMYYRDVSINVGAFIGFYQPTGDLSSGELKGFALSIEVNHLMK